MMGCFRLVLSLALLLCSRTALVNAEEGGKVIGQGSKVKFDYTLMVDGSVADTSEGRGPLEYVHGAGTIISGLARQLEGMRAGEEKDAVVLPEEGYGKVDVNAFKEISKSKLSLSGDVNLQPGAQVQGEDEQGRRIAMRVAEVKEDTVIFDLNHPLAGKTLNFHVKIVSIE